MKTVSPKKQAQFSHYLNQDEEMLFFSTVGPLYLLNKFIWHFTLVFMASGVIAGILFILLKTNFSILIIASLGVALIYAFQRYYFTKEGIQYILTNKRLIVQTGFFQVTLKSAAYHTITHLEVRQSLMERWFYHHGEIVIRTAGADNNTIYLKHLPDPIRFKTLTEKLIADSKNLY